MTDNVGIASFFAGIGGFDLAFEREGLSSSFQCEVDPFCISVLEKHWPNVPRHTDIRLLSPTDVPDADVWCGGFPCQDVSVARGAKGRDGLKGQNSGLFFSFLELIRARLPSVLVLENVVGLLSSHNGQDFRIILEELSALGYSVAWRIMNSRYFGAPQSRPRVFICASRDDSELPLHALFEQDAGSSPTGVRAGFLQADSCPKSGAFVPRVAYCLAATSGRHTGTDWSRTYIAYSQAVRRLTPVECEGLQGFPQGWTAPTGGRTSGNSHDFDTPRYQALGNAVAVPVVQWIARRIRERLLRRPERKRVSRHSQLPLLGEHRAIDGFEDFAHKSVRHLQLNDLHYATQPNGHCLRWQSGGFVSGDACVDVKAPEAPSQVSESPLISVIEETQPADHYYLSPNAAEGILRRVESQNRTLFAPTATALRRMARMQ